MSQQTENKERTIKIRKQGIYDDIDSLTYKYAEVSSVPSPQQRDAMSSDVKESLDGHLMARNVEFREAQVRKMLRRFIKAEEVTVIADDDLQQNEYIEYHLIVPTILKDELLKSVATYIHRYIVYGALYDWYAAGMGSKQSAVYAAELDQIEAEINNAMIPDTTIIPPLNPWGRPRNLR
ncbi:MAG: hypothetical protein IKW84_08955 [Bacteroidaceae bacterium]|nr:hypothetical protein [Bacteroidaceae bacterium]MBR5159691.1 hypothetical protein [Bacteroidaceae bacterium]